MQVDQKRVAVIRQVKQSLTQDSSQKNKRKQAMILKGKGINLSQYNSVIKLDLLREREKQIKHSKDKQLDIGLSLYE